MKTFKGYLEESMYHMAKHAEESAPRRHHEAMLDHHISMGNHYHEKSIPWSEGGNARMNSHRTDYHTKMMEKHDQAAAHHEDALNLLDKHGKDHPKYHKQRDTANAASQKLT